MFVTKATNLKEIKYVLNNLNDECVFELKAIFGDNYKEHVLSQLKVTERKYLIKVNSTKEPVGISGVLQHPNPNVGGLFFLTTNSLKKCNMIKLLRLSREYVSGWEKEFKVLVDSCYKGNTQVKKWLAFLGFKPFENQFDYIFDSYFKGDINELNRY